MNLKKRIILGLLIIILLAVVIFISFGVWNYMQQKKDLKESLNDFSRIIELGNLDDITLTIYYMNLSMDTPYPYSVDRLIKSSTQIIIDGNSLKPHVNLLNQLSKEELVPVMWKSSLDARIYYVFETVEDGKILDVAMWGEGNNIFVNGIEVQENDIFYDVIIRFLPDDLVKGEWGLEAYLCRRNPEE